MCISTSPHTEISSDGNIDLDDSARLLGQAGLMHTYIHTHTHTQTHIRTHTNTPHTPHLFNSRWLIYSIFQPFSISDAKRATIVM